MLQMSLLCWVHHANRMPDKCLPKRIFYGEFQTGVCSNDGQRKCFKHNLKVSTKDLDIESASWETLTQDKPGWHSIVSKEQLLMRNIALRQTKSKWTVCTTWASSFSIASVPPAMQSCPHSSRHCQAMFGFMSLLLSHTGTARGSRPSLLLRDDHAIFIYIGMKC